MSIIMTKNERKQISAKAFNITWNIDHGTMAQCSTMATHIQSMKNVIWWEYAIEKKADGLGSKYHLHMEVLFSEETLMDSLSKNVLRTGRKIGEKADPEAKITGASKKVKRAFDETWVASYCHGKEVEEVVKSDVSGPFKEEWKEFFPTQEEQDEFQQIANATDEGMEKLAIEFTKWCEVGDAEKGIPFNSLYLLFLDGDANLEEMVCAFLDDMMFVKKKMKVVRDKRRLVHLKQAMESYVASSFGVSRRRYRDWFATQEEIARRPSQVKKRMKEKEIEDDILINSVLNS